MILRPYGVVIGGALELGLEVVVENGVIQQIRPHTGIPDLYILSTAFVNAHSHLEYRGLMGKIQEPEYSSWIRAITQLKKEQAPEQIAADCLLAAQENMATGVGYILEHSDRPFAAHAMKAVGLEGVIFQEVITILERESAKQKLEHVRNNAKQNGEVSEVFLNPHAYQTVDRETLKWLAEQHTPLSIHVAETDYENQLTLEGTGPIADFYRQCAVPFEPTRKSVLASLDDLGLVRHDTQLVHCCAIDEADIEIIKRRASRVAHCPRSNSRLKCPSAPIRELLDAGVPVGLGLDSAASSGPIDMFAEMRAALQTSIDRGCPLMAEEVWQMATEPPPLFKEKHQSTIEKGSRARLIKIHVQSAEKTEHIIEQADPGMVEWI